MTAGVLAVSFKTRSMRADTLATMITEPTTVELGPFSVPGAVVTPWATALHALRSSQKYWLSTVRESARPHVTPLLAAVALDGVCFVTGSHEQKSRNMHRNPHVVLTTGVNTLTGTDYVIEGTAFLIDDPDRLDEAADTVESAFGWHLTDPDGNWYGMGDWIRQRSNELWEVVPTRAFANSDGRYFSQTRYTWRP